MNTRDKLEQTLRTLLPMAQTGADKTPMLPLAQELDQLTQSVLDTQGFRDDYEPEIHLKGGNELAHELNALSEQDAPESMPLIADAMIRNLNQRLNHDLGLYLTEPAVTGRLKGTICLHSFGTVFSMDESPGQIKAEQDRLHAAIRALGLHPKAIPSRSRPGELAFVLDYTENRGSLSEYFKALNAKPVYAVQNNVIDHIDISIPVDSFVPFSSPDMPEPNAAWSDTLSEPDAFSLQKSIRRYLELIRISFQGDAFQPIMEQEIPLNLFWHYTADIEQILQPDLPIAQAVVRKHAAARAENLAAKDLQTQKGLRLLQSGLNRQTLVSHYQAIYATMTRFIYDLGAEIDELSLHDYGRISLSLSAGRLNPVKHPVLDVCRGERSYDLWLCNTEYNWETITKRFRALDPNARIETVSLDRERRVRCYYLNLCDFQAIQRLLRLVPIEKENVL